MVILEVFSKNIVISYKSTFVSKATLLTLTFGVVTVVLPFVIAYKSKGKAIVVVICKYILLFNVT
jgi:hypothetical protein